MRSRADRDGGVLTFLETGYIFLNTRCPVMLA
jgi:hypothetical protein